MEGGDVCWPWGAGHFAVGVEGGADFGGGGGDGDGEGGVVGGSGDAVGGWGGGG